MSITTYYTQLPKATARLICDVDGSNLTFHFNPSTINFSKSAKYQRNPNQASVYDPSPSFQGVTATYLNMQILLDAVENQPFDDVAKEVNQLLKWTLPLDPKSDAPSPPMLKFVWGKLRIVGENTFTGHLENVQVNYQMFNRRGAPIRAMVQVSLASVTEDAKYTNPTSGAVHTRRSHVLRRGEDLQSVAYLAYGDASRWRVIAAANGIDNPFAVKPGRELMLPDRLELPEVR